MLAITWKSSVHLSSTGQKCYLEIRQLKAGLFSQTDAYAAWEPETCIFHSWTMVY